MSGGIEDVARDGELGRAADRCYELEKKFQTEPSMELATAIITAWERLESMPRGYWYAPPKLFARSRESLYRSWHLGDPVPEPLPDKMPTDVDMVILKHNQQENPPGGRIIGSMGGIPIVEDPR